MASPPALSDRELIHSTMAATGLSARSLARVLDVDERTVRRWLAGDRVMPGPAVQLCRALARDSSLVLAFREE